MVKKTLQILLLLMIMATSWVATGQTIQIGHGTSTTWSVPINIRHNYTFAEMIYQQSDFDGFAHTSNDIVSIAYDHVGKSKAQTITIYMKNVDITAFPDTSTDFIPVTADDIVYSGQIVFLNGWNTITLDNKFAYDPTKNLLIAVNKTAGGTASSDYYWHYFERDNSVMYISTEDDDNHNNRYPGVYEGPHPYQPESTDPETMIPWGQRSVKIPNIRITFGLYAPTDLEAHLTDCDGTEATLSWTENDNATDWVLQYDTDETFTKCTTITSGFNTLDAPTIMYHLTGLTPETTYYARVKSYESDDVQSEWSQVIEFTPTNAALLTLYEPAGNTGQASYAPFFRNVKSYGDIASQFIMPAQDVVAIQGGTISELTFYNTNQTLDYGNAEFTVYVKEVDYTTQTSYTDWTTLTEVYSGRVLVEHGMLAIKFNTPIAYNNGNLLVGFKQIKKGSANAASNTKWYGDETKPTGSAYYSYSSVSASLGFLPKVTINYLPGTGCITPGAFEATNTNTTATLTWASNASQWQVAHSTDPEANPNDNIVALVDTPTYIMNDLALGNHYFWVRSYCGTTEQSEWAGPALVNIDYCYPSPSNVDGDGISHVSFGIEGIVVNNDTPKATYTDCHDLVGAVYQGVEATVAITYSTGYTYGTIIWVDLNNNASFEEDEILYKGSSDKANPTTLGAMIVVPYTQPLGDYRMRIGGADSAFDAYIQGTSTTAPNPCYDGNWACFQDYTLRVLEAPDCMPANQLAVTTDVRTATFTWESESDEWDVAHSTSATDDPNEHQIASELTDKQYQMENLANGDHYFWVRSHCGSQVHSPWAGPVKAHIGYCVPNPTSVDGDGITNVTYGTGEMIVNQDTPKATYTDNSNLIGTLQAGVTSPISITYATNYTYGTIIWVDWNNNLIFEEDEIVYTGESGSANPTTLNASIHIAASQALGDYRMRIGGADSAFDGYIHGTITDVPDPCYSGSYACFQDYTIRVTEAPGCLAPENLSATEDQPYSSVLSWTALSEETAWSLYYKKVSDETYTEVAVTENPSYTLENLSPATNYQYYVVANCSSEGSQPSPVCDFTTTCPTIMTVPYVENFDNYTLASSTVPMTHVLPHCWDYINTSTNSNNIVYPSMHTYTGANYAHSNPNYVRFYCVAYSDADYDPQDQYAILPTMENISGLRLKLYARAMNTSSNYDATFKVGVMEGNNFVQVGDDIIPTTEVYQQYIISFASYTGNGTNIAIMMEKPETPTTSWTLAYKAVFIDDITVEEIPSCLEPTNLELTATGKHTLSFSWTAGGTETNWKLQYKKQGDTDWVTVDETITEASYTVQNLDAATIYDARVAALCDPANPEDISAYCDPISATTDCDVITSFPWVVTFDNFAANTVPMCWDNSASTAQEVTAKPDYVWGVYSFGENQMIRMFNFYVHSGTALINSPEITLPSEPMELVFDYSNRASCGPLTVKISEDGGTTFTDLQSYDVTGAANYSDPGEFTEATISLAAYAGKSVIIQFYSYANYGSGAIFVDDVIIDVIPACAKPTNLACSSTTAHTATLSWTNGEAGQEEWQIAYSTEAEFNPNDVTPVSVTTNPCTITDLTGNTTYYAYVRAKCGDDYSSWNNKIVNFTTVIGNAQPTNLAVDPTSVTVNHATVSWNGVTSNDNHDYYELYYSDQNVIPSPLEAGSLISDITATSYEFTTLDENQTYYVWVRDYCGVDGYSAWTQSISFTTAKTCQDPDNVIASEVTAHSAKISWNTYGQTTFNLRYRVKETSTWTTINETTCPYIFDNTLTNNTTYEIQVQVICDTEVWSDIYSFSTECDAITIDETHKYFEDFEHPVVTSVYGSIDDLHVPGCWDNDTDSPSAKQTYPHMISATSQYNYATSGQVLYFYGQGNNYALLPEFTNAINELQIKFKWATEGSSQGTLTLGYITFEDNNYNTFTPIKSYAASVSSQGKLIPETVYLSNVPNTAVRLVFCWYYSSWYGANVDDVEVSLIPSCLPVETLSYNSASITSSSVVLNWTLVDENQDAWEIQYATNAEFTQNVNNVNVTTHENVTIDELEEDTHYYVHVRSNCGGTDGYSEWSDAIDFTTLPSCPVPTGLVANDITQVSADLTWETSTEVDLYTVQYRPSASYDLDYTEEFTDEEPATYDAVDYELPDEWYSYNSSATGFEPRVSNSNKYSYISAFGTGNNFLLMTTNAVDQSAYAIMPPYDELKVVEFDYAFESASYGTLSVGYVSDESDYNSYVLLQILEPKATKTHFRLSNADIATVNDDGGYIAFCYVSGNTSYYSVGIDNVHVCAGNEDVDDWTTATAAAPNTGTYQLTGLAANTKYDVRVYSNCSTDIEVENCTITMTTMETGNKVFATAGEWGTASNWIPAGAPILTDNVILRANVTIESGCIALANKITLEGTTTPTITIEDGGQLLAGSLLNATVKKTITGYGDGLAETNKGYHLIATPTVQAIPTTAGLITDDLGSTATTETSTYDLYEWNATATAQWKNYRDNVFSLTNAKGYLYASRNGVDVTFSGGLLNNATPKTVNLTYNTSAAAGKWNLIGNPFVCNANISIGDNATVNYYKIGTGDEDGTLVAASGPIAPMEGIFVKATAESQQATFTRVEPNMSTNNKDGILEIALNNTNNRGMNMIDNARVRFGEGNELEKFQLNGGSSKVYIPQDGTDYAVVYSKGEGRMPVNVKVAKTGEYTISFSNEDVEFDYLHLIDNFTGADIDLLIDESYSFTASTKDKENRFFLVFKAIDSNYDPTSDIFVYQNGDELIVNGDGTLQVYDVMGRFVASYEVNGNKRINASQFSNAVYIFRMVGETVKTQKIVVR